jgi:protein involved in polysaccharide export with SLBB domain
MAPGTFRLVSRAALPIMDGLMNALLRRPSTLLALPVFFALSACSWIKLPKVSMPSLPKMPDIDVPFVGDDSTAPKDDPSVPYSLRQPLAPGHTLELTAYAGQRSPAKIFSGTVMVDEDGKADFGRFGKVKLAGLNATQAVVQIEGVMRRKRGESLIVVHLKRIEDIPLLAIEGAVARPGVIQFYDEATPVNVLPYAGGRDARTTGRALYVTREGVRQFYTNYATADVELQRGDIVTYSDEL